MVGPGGEAQANLVNGLRVKQLQKAPLNANGFLSRCQNWSVCQETVAYLVQGDALMTGPHDLSDGPELAVTETPGASSCGPCSSARPSGNGAHTSSGL